MPNYISNRLEIKGNTNKVFKIVKGKNGIMDFEKIIPMPGGLSDVKKLTWASKNWDTKWNSVNSFYKERDILFDTAWNPPLKVIAELSKMFRKIEFKITWADEEKGYRTGEATYLRGKCIKVIEFTDCSKEAKEAYKFAKGMLY